MLTASHVLKEHPFLIKQEDEVPELATVIRERGIWPRHRSLAVFWSPSSARDRSCEFNIVGQDTLLGGTIKRVKLDDGSYLNVLDDCRVTQSRSDLKVWNATFFFRQRQSSMSLIPTAMELTR